MTFHLLAAILLAAAQPGGDDAPGGFALTIYSSADPATFDPRRFGQVPPAGLPSHLAWSLYPAEVPGFGLVRERRRVELAAGLNAIRVTDVAAHIDPTTVTFRSLTDPAAKVVEQDYQYDLVDADKLLKKFVDRRIHATRRGPAGVVEVRGTLLSFDDRTLVVREDGGIVSVVPRNEDLGPIQLADPGAELVTRPTLAWSLYTEQAGAHDAEIAYQADGLTWRADYTLVLAADERSAALSSWVTILNESGASFPDAALKLIAGEVQRLEPQGGGMGGMGGGVRGAAGPPAGFEEKAFFEYHLYTLGRRTTLADRSTKQIELFDARPAVPVEKTLVYDGGSSPRRGAGFRSFAPAGFGGGFEEESDTAVDVYLSFRNTKANGLGIPFPAGRVRVSKRDGADGADGALEFIGEDAIGHTPRDEPVMVRLGESFDVVGDRTQVTHQVDKDRHHALEGYEIRLANHKAEPVRVIVRERLSGYRNWTITGSSDPFEKQDSRTIHIPVDVAADGEKVVTYTVEYTW